MREFFIFGPVRQDDGILDLFAWGRLGRWSFEPSTVITKRCRLTVLIKPLFVQRSRRVRPAGNRHGSKCYWPRNPYARCAAATGRSFGFGGRCEKGARRAWLAAAIRSRNHHPLRLALAPRAVCMIILGLNAFHGDSSAALVRDGLLVAAAEEERFRRVKHWAGFPSEPSPTVCARRGCN